MSDLNQLITELEACHVKRQAIAERLREARKLGDLVTNEAHAAAKAEEKENEAKIDLLEKTIRLLAEG